MSDSVKMFGSLKVAAGVGVPFSQTGSSLNEIMDMYQWAMDLQVQKLCNLFSLVIKLD
jgi:hypothetical protein